MCVCVDMAAGAGAHRRGEATGTATGGDDGDRWGRGGDDRDGDGPGGDDARDDGAEEKKQRER